MEKKVRREKTWLIFKIEDRFFFVKILFITSLLLNSVTLFLVCLNISFMFVLRCFATYGCYYSCFFVFKLRTWIILFLLWNNLSTVLESIWYPHCIKNKISEVCFMLGYHVKVARWGRCTHIVEIWGRGGGVMLNPVMLIALSANWEPIGNPLLI